MFWLFLDDIYKYNIYFIYMSFTNPSNALHGNQRFLQLADVDINSFVGQNNNLVVVDPTATGLTFVNAGSVVPPLIGTGNPGDIPTFSASIPPVFNDSMLWIGDVPVLPNPIKAIDFNHGAEPENQLMGFVDNFGAMNDILAFGANASGSNVNPCDVAIINGLGADIVDPVSLVVINEGPTGSVCVVEGDSAVLNGPTTAGVVDNAGDSLVLNGGVSTLTGGLAAMVQNNSNGDNLLMNASGVQLTANSVLDLNIASNTGANGDVLTADGLGHCRWLASAGGSSSIPLAAFQSAGAQTIPITTAALLSMNVNSVNGGLGPLWGGSIFTAPVGGGCYKFTVMFNSSLLDFLSSMEVLLNGVANPVYGQFMNLGQSNLCFSYLYNLSAGQTIAFRITNTSGLFPIVINNAYLMIEQLQPFI
jgi:hypothetical protein